MLPSNLDVLRHIFLNLTCFFQHIVTTKLLLTKFTGEGYSVQITLFPYCFAWGRAASELFMPVLQATSRWMYRGRWICSMLELIPGYYHLSFAFKRYVSSYYCEPKHSHSFTFQPALVTPGYHASLILDSRWGIGLFILFSSLTNLGTHTLWLTSPHSLLQLHLGNSIISHPW